MKNLFIPLFALFLVGAGAVIADTIIKNNGRVIEVHPSYRVVAVPRNTPNQVIVVTKAEVLQLRKPVQVELRVDAPCVPAGSLSLGGIPCTPPQECTPDGALSTGAPPC